MEVSCPICGACQEDTMHVFGFVYGQERCGKQLHCGLLLIDLKGGLLEIYLAGWMIREEQMRVPTLYITMLEFMDRPQYYGLSRN